MGYRGSTSWELLLVPKETPSCPTAARKTGVLATSPNTHRLKVAPVVSTPPILYFVTARERQGTLQLSGAP